MKRVRVKRRAIPVRTRKLSAGTWGQASKHSDGKREITLRPGLSGIARLRTLVHEMLHHADFRLGEKTVLALEDEIVQMVIENPELFHELARVAR